MNPVFVRHNLDSPLSVLIELWEDKRIALHYEDLFSTSPGDYPKQGAMALSRLWDYCKKGAIVGAVYRGIRPAYILVGEILPGSTIEAKEYKDTKDQSKRFVYKTVQLAEAKEISLVRYPVLAGAQPRHATITGWPSVSNVLEAAYNEVKLEEKVQSLHPSQLETLCYEYLSKLRELTALICPIGRSLNDIDILGLDGKGQIVVAQVTHSTDPAVVIDKCNRLTEFDDNVARRILFAPSNVVPHSRKVEFISIESVFEFACRNIELKPAVNWMLGGGR